MISQPCREQSALQAWLSPGDVLLGLLEQGWGGENALDKFQFPHFFFPLNVCAFLINSPGAEL